MPQPETTHLDKTPFDNFTDLARRLFAVPKYELDEEIAKEKSDEEKSDVKTEKPARKPKLAKQKEAA